MSVFSLLEQLDPLRGMPAVLLVLAAAAVAVAAWDLRLALPALALQFLFSGLLYVDNLDPRLALVFVFVGLVATTILVVTAWQTNWGRPPNDLTDAERDAWRGGPTREIGPFTPTDRQLIRLGLVVAALVVLGIVWQADGLSLDSDQLAVQNMATLGLAVLGLIGLTVSAAPLASGIGLLLLLNGFELYYTVTEQSIAMIIGLSAVNLIVALVVSYMAQTRPASIESSD